MEKEDTLPWHDVHKGSTQQQVITLWQQSPGIKANTRAGIKAGARKRASPNEMGGNVTKRCTHVIRPAHSACEIPARISDAKPAAVQ
eukprot:1161972-Pelagomonas_calceolata.AAC.4